MAASSTWSSSSSLFIPREETLWYYIAILSVLSLLGQELSRCSVLANTADFEGFGDDIDDDDFSDSSLITDLPIRSNLPPSTTLTSQSDFETDHGPPLDSSSSSTPISDPTIPNKPSSNSFDFWDEDEFEGLPIEQKSTNLKSPDVAAEAGSSSKVESDSKVEVQVTPPLPKTLGSFTVEIVCVSFLIAFLFNYFSGKKENENIALAWASRFATKDSIFDKNFSLLGTGDGKDTPLLLKEGQNVFKFYASGRRFCQGMLATMDLQSRHDLMSRIYNMIVPCKDEITFEVYMNDDAMDNVVFALAKKKLAKVMHKELRDLQRFASLVTSGPNNRKWVADELMVITESKEVAGDLITETVLDQGSHRKMLILKFALPDAKNMADMTRLVALVPYYIDLIGRYKLSPQARPKTEAARTKVAQEVYKELHNARQEALQKKKAEKRKMAEEAEAKLSAEVLRKREAKDRAKQMKKVMPKVKMTRAH
ncbi:hypothetical protein AQUCO_11500003v1 [Aquilegia coerulea]|uniref:DUF1682 domain-containing protein n=1 Tax=Aquilegia coerulea TaxID=218851 RepID=A0A2G5C2D2_AQUCA|nr:hypothetical protein AQUCO_11500003v1 [Aquilegia coerulea]